MDSDDRFIRMKELRTRVGLSVTTIYRMVGEGSFPPKRSIGKSSFWLESEVTAWMKAQMPEGGEGERWTPPPSPPRNVGEPKLPPLVSNEKGAEAAAKIAGVVGVAVLPDEAVSDTEIALRFPDWPEMMRRRTAAAYLDLSESAFIREVYRGTLPNPVVLGGRESWSRQKIDGALAVLLTQYR